MLQELKTGIAALDTESYGDSADNTDCEVSKISLLNGRHYEYVLAGVQHFCLLCTPLQHTWEKSY